MDIGLKDILDTGNRNKTLIEIQSLIVNEQNW